MTGFRRTLVRWRPLIYGLLTGLLAHGVAKIVVTDDVRQQTSHCEARCEALEQDIEQARAAKANIQEVERAIVGYRELWDRRLAPELVAKDWESLVRGRGHTTVDPLLIEIGTVGWSQTGGIDHSP